MDNQQLRLEINMKTIKYHNLEEALNNEKQIPVGRAKNLINQKFGKLTVICRIENKNSADRNSKWLARCECGNYIPVFGRCLNGNTISCGCSHIKNNIGEERYGWICTKILDITDSNQERVRLWQNNKCLSCLRNCPAKFFKKECGIQRVTSDLTWCESLSQRHFECLCYLLDNNIKFKMEYWFQDLKSEKPLRFDFAIFNNDDKLIELVEIQGDQHYNPGFLSQNGFEKFQKQQIRDSLKNKYCEDNNIKLVII